MIGSVHSTDRTNGITLVVIVILNNCHIAGFVMIKQSMCCTMIKLCEYKDTDQPGGNLADDQRFSFSLHR